MDGISSPHGEWSSSLLRSFSLPFADPVVVERQINVSTLSSHTAPCLRRELRGQERQATERWEQLIRSSIGALPVTPSGTPRDLTYCSRWQSGQTKLSSVHFFAAQKNSR